MKKGLKVTVVILAVVILLAAAGLMYITRVNAIKMVYNPIEGRTMPTEPPSNRGIPYEDVSATTDDGFSLAGWFIPSQNGAVVIAQHGLFGHRDNMLDDAELLYRHGYGVLLSSFRAHDVNEGELVTYGKNEVKDMEAWYQLLLTRTDIDPERIGILGESMGGMVTILYSAQNTHIRAVALHSAAPSIDAAATKAIEHYFNLPPFPFVPLIIWWGEQMAGFDSSQIDAIRVIGQISPRPVLIMMGGQDDHLPAQSGQWLYDAADEPKQLWFVPNAGHHGIPEVDPAGYEQHVIEFFDTYLLGE
ncbi:MAG TPA: alpha/beta hydrolase [Anaerolineales bacterium]